MNGSHWRIGETRSRQFRDSSMQVMELYVERARLEALGRLIMTKGLNARC
jgi:hypothetical protein